MGRYSTDPVTDAELSAIADLREEERNRPPSPHPLDGVFERSAQVFAEDQPRVPAAEIAAISMAISLKRIADTMDGTAAGICITETLIGDQAHGR